MDFPDAELRDGGLADFESNVHTIHAPPSRALSPITSNAMNTLNGTSSTLSALSKSNSASTIRSVPSESLQLDTKSSSPDEERRNHRSDPTAMPHATKASPQTSVPDSQPPLSRHNSNLAVENGLVRKISSEFGPTRSYTNSSLQIPDDASPTSNGNSVSPGGQWSSAVGRANLGKSGRVIERLMGENDMLKRDLNLERLRAEESKQAVRMAEGKMDALTAEYDGKLHDAAINKALLKRRERQVAEMKSQIEAEKHRADKAVERERGWREAMEKIEEDSKRSVEDAQILAALMKGRNEAMTSHWRDRGVEVNKTVAKLGEEIGIIVQERRADDDRMNMLQELCDQQAEQLTALQAEKDGIGEAFERYKIAQEDALKDIKERARSQEKANEAALQETQKLLGELKWALNIKKNVKGAD
ncbi:related to putative cytoplasmic structural protein [Rhynchosporium secalis]|uniref:Related to putative cytoplasmic structural protein n=1 Tax=Rhynchosporium secalis TaxID=38038 RepID=A0A1E1M900_RHYSE|nr:related to putative cytoplasmic structural protein [Rhynchosporium secalis]